MESIKPLNDPSLSIAGARQQQTLDKAGSRDAASLKQASQDFEAIFIQSLFKAMRKTVPESEIFGNKTANTMFVEMLDAEVASQISKKQSLGLADQIYRQLEQYLPNEDDESSL